MRTMDSLGRNLNRIRSARGMSLRDLAEAANVSPSFLSQIENDKTSPSISSLTDIARGLGTTVARLIEESPNRANPVTRKSGQKHMSIGDPPIDMQLLTDSDLHKKMEPILFVMPPGSSSGSQPYSHVGQEVALVLSGQLGVTLDRTDYYLETGDSIYFDSNRPHSFHNPGATETRVIWVVTPPTC
ncbi:MAG: MerR family transcriptional regulator [Armatimonadetes bacterium CG_4_10_14_0_8_um_filter_66_14]|nr:cupin domain-containing protein [Armatimonadota bacterium]NCQ26172.1 cupin domain-containing protein [Armatimonadota bacterium]PIZ49778.1 MAG: MerR family transcriptional regulator [Armatimonadetes bacterium CG_4_10_14_0_8_um_filter_66_14]PJB60794.1 MAG: MerR family transcriptional regulator [Armatimonadetes bacterium CG_4_9_14_3_um_filter_66_14]